MGMSFVYFESLFSFQGTKREAELDDISPSKLKALKAARNGRNGDGPVDDESSNHKNGDDHLHDDEDEDDDDVSLPSVDIVGHIDTLFIGFYR